MASIGKVAVGVGAGRDAAATATGATERSLVVELLSLSLSLSLSLRYLVNDRVLGREQGLPTVTRRSPSGSDGFQGPPLAIGSAQAGMRNDGNGRSGAREFPRAHS